MESAPRPPEPSARERLLAGAARVFSRLGFEAATTRLIADEAGVNLASIPYYFGTKEALYLAVADMLCDRFMTRMQPALETLRERLGGTRSEAAEAFVDLVDVHVAHLTSEDMAEANALLSREQTNPSTAFPRIYRRVIEPQLELAAHLMARLMDRDPQDLEVRARTHTVLGMGVHLAFAPQSFAAFIGEDPAQAVAKHPLRIWIRDLVARALPDPNLPPSLPSERI